MNHITRDELFRFYPAASTAAKPGMVSVMDSRLLVREDGCELSARRFWEGSR